MGGDSWRQQLPKAKKFHCDEERRPGQGLEGDRETQEHFYKMGDTRVF